jgi:hypothetical protein
MNSFIDSVKVERMIAEIQRVIESRMAASGMALSDNVWERIMQQVFIDNDATAGEIAAVEGEF